MGDIRKVVDKLVPTIREHIGNPFHVRICKGKLCELHRFKEPEDIGTNTIVIGVDAVKFFQKEYGKSLERTVRNMLVHELIHVLGMDHNREGYKKGFYSAHYMDTYTPKIEKEIFGS